MSSSVSDKLEPGCLYVCVQNCSECGKTHCTATTEEILRREEQTHDYCPVGNRELWRYVSGRVVK